MALDFPNSPTLGQVYTYANKSWSYDGSKWVIKQYNNAIDDDVTAYIDAEVQEAKDYADAKTEEAIAFAILFS